MASSTHHSPSGSIDEKKENLMPPDENDILTARLIGGLETAFKMQTGQIKNIFDLIASQNKALYDFRIEMQPVLNMVEQVHRQGEELRTLIPVKQDVDIIKIENSKMKDKQEKTQAELYKLAAKVAVLITALTAIGEWLLKHVNI